MNNMRRYAIGLAATIFAASLFSSAAYAGCINCGAPKPGKGCDQMVTLKHPDLKPGPQRKGEWKKCMANPGGYNG